MKRMTDSRSTEKQNFYEEPLMRAFILPILLLITRSVIAATPLTFEEADTDGDGLINADKTAHVEGLDFNTTGSDHNGTLTVDEYDVTVEKLLLLNAVRLLNPPPRPSAP